MKPDIIEIRQKLNHALSSIPDILKTRPLLVFSVLVSVFILSRLYISIEPLLVVALILSVATALIYIFGKIDLFITIFICFSMFLGLFVSDFKLEKSLSLADALNGDFVRIYGSVSSIPVSNSGRYKFVLECDKIYSVKGEYDNKIKIQVNCKDNFNFEYGNKITLNCKLVSVRGSKFVFEKSYLSKGILFIADDATFLTFDNNYLSTNITHRIRNYILDTGDKFFSGEESMLFKALTAGDRSTFSKELKSNLNRSGLMHIACVSGLHISVIGMALYGLLKRKARLPAGILSVLSVWFFAFIVGANPSTIRAAIMFTSYISAKMSLNENDSVTALMFSAMVIGLMNPYAVYDTGCMLSFLSVFGIQVFGSFFKSVLRFMPKMLRESVAVTLSAQIMTAPLLINMFGYMSAVSVFSNAVVSAIFVYILYMCLLFVPVSAIPGLNNILSLPVRFSLHVLSSVAHMFGNLPVNVINLHAFGFIEIIIYYGLIMMFIFRKKISAYFISFAMILFSLILAVSKMI